MKMRSILAVLSAAVMCMAMSSCGGRSSDSSSSDTTSAAADTTPAGDAAANASETTAAAVPEGTTTEEAAVNKPEETTAAAAAVQTTTAPSTSPAEPSSKGYTDALSLAADFYDAYLRHDPDAVYGMFDPEEIKCYKTCVADMLDGKDPEEVFGEDALIQAIDDSMTFIESIMDEYNSASSDVWKVNVTKDQMEDVSDDDLEGFNDDLGTSFTSGTVINYMFYENTSNGETFVGNSSAFLEKSGKWYVSFSSLMQSELINYIEV